LFRDEKSQGFQWQRSRVTDPTHSLRLLVVMALATLLALSLGTWVLKTGRRSFLKATRRRLLSLFQLGLRWLRYALDHDQPLPCRLSLYPQ
jgi:hypothetical protein